MTFMQRNCKHSGYDEAFIKRIEDRDDVEQAIGYSGVFLSVGMFLYAMPWGLQRENNKYFII